VGQKTNIYCIIIGLECLCGCDTNRIEQHRKKQLTTTDAFVQLLRASWVIFVEDGVCEKPTCLPGENLIHKATHNLVKSNYTNRNKSILG